MHTPLELSSQQLFPNADSSLPERLAHAGVQQLLSSRGLNRPSYTTERYLGDVTTSSVAGLDHLVLAPGASLVLEGFSPRVQAYCAEHGLDLLDDASMYGALPTISAALTSTIQPLPFLYQSVTFLAWRCHLVRAPEDAFDVSFSDPQIPFSIFVSVPQATRPSSALRVAENLVHETMHLLLTLFESEQPLIESQPSALLYSPWKHELRPAQGVLHGLYVFAILRWMWQQTVLRTSFSEVCEFARQRIVEIDEDVRAVEPLADSAALTVTGRDFVRQLLDFARQTS